MRLSAMASPQPSRFSSSGPTHVGDEPAGRARVHLALARERPRVDVNRLAGAGRCTRTTFSSR
jgi:hypothetical protein